MIIGGKEIRSGNKIIMNPPHEIAHTLGYFHRGERKHIDQAIQAALAARPSWEALNWENRAAIFLKAADLLAGKYRSYMNAATMIAQSKNPYQAEIDAVCELIDFLRFNTHYLSEIYRQQPNSSSGVHNRLEYRPLEGFVLAITPFNFTAIGGNLPSSAALCGNVVLWKPADTQIFSAHFFMKIMLEAGLPDGVINLIYPEGPELGDVCFSHPDFGGIHFTGSTAVFNNIWKSIGENIGKYKSYPRIVGETVIMFACAVVASCSVSPFHVFTPSATVLLAAFTMLSELAPLSALPSRVTVKERLLEALDSPSAIAEPALIWSICLSASGLLLP